MCPQSSACSRRKCRAVSTRASTRDREGPCSLVYSNRRAGFQQHSMKKRDSPTLHPLLLSTCPQSPWSPTSTSDRGCPYGGTVSMSSSLGGSSWPWVVLRTCQYRYSVSSAYRNCPSRRGATSLGAPAFFARSPIQTSCHRLRFQSYPFFPLHHILDPLSLPSRATGVTTFCELADSAGL